MAERFIQAGTPEDNERICPSVPLANFESAVPAE